MEKTANPETVAHERTARSLGLRDAALVLIAPRSVFARVEDVPAYGWLIVCLVSAFVLIGYLTVQTGMIDREVERRVQGRIAALEPQKLDVVERSAVSKMIEEQREQGNFERMAQRAVELVLRPVRAVVVVLILAAVFYALVAMTGRKPEWHTLVTICVLASFVDVIAAAGRLALSIHLRTLYVDTSISRVVQLLAGGQTAPDAAQAKALICVEGMLTALDPFRIWFWLIVATGLIATSQLRGWRAWVPCTMLWLTAAGFRALGALAAASQADAAGRGP